MIDRFNIIDHGSPRPDADKIIFCDGSGGSLFRPETDLDLSHWRPNRTPKEYRAGTSTEICVRFLENPRPGPWTVAVNNHVDVDGILSVYALVHSDHALAHRRAIIEAAEIGDFWGWGEPPAQRLFQGVTHLMQKGGEPQSIYQEAFRRISGLIEGSDPQVAEIEKSLTPLRDGIELVEQGRIARRQLDAHFVHYIVPLAVAADDDTRASYVPEFNEAVSPKMFLWPQVRARWDAERVSLVSVERRNGWLHDLWFPGYLWADTEGRWLVPGMTYHDGMSRYEIHNDKLISSFEELQQQETAPGRWGLGGSTLPFGEELQERFPLVGRFLNERGVPAVSGLLPDELADRLAGVFD
jgi:hypothetical protein